MIFATLQTRLIAAGAAIIGVLAILLRVFYAGKNAAKVESMEKVLDDVKTKNDVSHRVDSLPAGSAADELRTKWKRR
jgi:hypothetical protein